MPRKVKGAGVPNIDYETGSISQPGDRTRRTRKGQAREETGTATDCIREMRRYERDFGTFEKRGKAIEKRYRDERDQDSPVNSGRCYNILWSNVQVLKPTLYARVPKAEVVRRFKDKDPIARLGAEIAERAADVEIERTGFHEVMKQDVLDRLLPGRGQAWVTYDPTIVSDGNALAKDGERIRLDYVGWRDFGHSPVPTWAEVTKVWRWKYFTKAEVKATFDNASKFMARLEFAERDKEETKGDDSSEPVARIAEVWDSKTRRVYWVSKKVADYLDEYDAPLDLQGFFPCAKPLYATLTNEKLEPVPDFYLYQDQADEVDRLTGRINNLTKALKVTGVYDQDVKSLQDLLNPKGIADNTLVPVNMTDLTGKGGLKQAVQLVPIGEVVATLEACYAAREQAINAIYQITGISDVLRGQSDPNETARAQDIKAQFGGTRIRDMQQDVATFARDTIRLMTEVVVENYEAETLWQMTNAASFVPMIPPDPQQVALAQQMGMPPPQPQPDVQAFKAALAFLKNDKLRSYRVDIETDSTIALDEADAKAAATEFVTAIGGLLAQAVPAMQSAPALAPFLKETVLYAARCYKAGRGLETALEESMDKLAQQPPMDPKQIEAGLKQVEQGKAEVQKLGEKAKGDQIAADLDKNKNGYDKALIGLERKMLDMEKGNAEREVKLTTGENILQLQKAALGATSQMDRSAMAVDAATNKALAAQKPDKERDEKERARDDGMKEFMAGVMKMMGEQGQLMANGFAELGKAMAAPKQITVQREGGKVTGAKSAQVRMN